MQANPFSRSLMDKGSKLYTKDEKKNSIGHLLSPLVFRHPTVHAGRQAGAGPPWIGAIHCSRRHLVWWHELSVSARNRAEPGAEGPTGQRHLMAVPHLPCQHVTRYPPWLVLESLTDPNEMQLVWDFVWTLQVPSLDARSAKSFVWLY